MEEEEEDIDVDCERNPCFSSDQMLFLECIFHNDGRIVLYFDENCGL